MQLREDWPEQLNAYVDSIRFKPFIWWENDCCTMVDNAVFAQTGEHFMAHMAGYSDGAGAYAKLLSVYGGGIDIAIAAIGDDLGWMRVDPNFAHRGAVMLIAPQFCGGDPRFGGALGLCIGAHVLVLTDQPVPYQLAAIARACCVASWNIPHPVGG